MAKNSFHSLFVDELRDAYDAEQQLIKALPKMAKASGSGQLRSGFEEHFEQTKNHVRRIEQILDRLGESPKGRKCKGIRGIVSEGKDVMDENYEGSLSDSAIISAARRVEHYEIAAYDSLRAWAELLGDTQSAALLGETLNEEQETDRKLHTLAQQIDPTAIQQRGGETARAHGAGA